MKNTFQNQAIGIPINTAAYTAKRSPLRYLPGPDGQYSQEYFKQCKADSMLKMMNKLGKKADNFANGVREHVRLGPKITETVKGKLSLGAKILQQVLLQAFYSSPLKKSPFCSERSIKFSSPSGKPVRVYYKVLVPLKKIKMVNQSENVKKPSQKYLELVTVDDFEFWFMGFINYQKTFKYLQQAMSQTSEEMHVTF
ncbi:hypothetical protein OIU84_006307 [Salix udensis]|uniref:GRAM domain-containing protein n=1 Tax=Salix udensis TaxID=889485 RepID=A0AAD6JZS4_9ROSI|nr:hypothetical protein OIU84_006307 [Salix udensis]